MPKMKVKTTDLADPQFLQEQANILNRGNEVKIKREKDKVVLVEEKRNVRHKVHIEEQ